MSILFITIGVIGSGKSTVANFVSENFDAEILSADIARKRMLDIRCDEKKSESYGGGIYSKESREQVYKELFKSARKKLKDQKNIIIDASFQKQKQRDKAREIADETKSRFIIVHCYAPNHRIKEWLAKRSKEGSVSDGRIEILDDFRKSFDKVRIDEKTVSIDTSNEDFLKEIKEKISNKIKSLP